MTLLREGLQDSAPNHDANQGIVSRAESPSIASPQVTGVRRFLDPRDPVEIAKDVITKDSRLDDRERESVLVVFTQRTEDARIKDFLPVLAHKAVNEAVRAKGASPQSNSLFPSVTETTAAPRSRRFTLKRR